MGKRWTAYYYLQNRYVHLGTFNTELEASAARRAATQEESAAA